MNRTILTFPLFVALGFLAVACTTGPSVKQRDYILPEVLTDHMQPQGDEADDPDKKLTRVGDVGASTVIVRPMLASSLAQSAEEVAFKNSYTKADTERLVRKALDTFSAKRTCFNVTAIANSSDAANLNYFSFFHDRDGTLVKLETDGKLEAPEEETRIRSYSSPGYTMSFGNRTTYYPGYSSAYSYKKYTGFGTFCAKDKIDLGKGLTIYVQARYKKDIPPQDFVWSVDPNDRKVFGYREGIPDPGRRVDWLKNRRAEIDAKFSKLTM